MTKDDIFASLMKVALLSSTVLAAPAVAQSTNADAEAEESDSTIVVIGTKRGDARLQDVPVAISAYQGEQLETLQIQSVDSIDLKTPGLVFTENSGTVQPYIRGIGTEFPTPGLEPSVSLYLDDVYWQRATGANYDLVDMESIQVLKGPQGTLYGRNATGGAILLTTANPEFETSGKVLAEYGNLDRQRVDAVINVPLSDTFAVRFAGRYADRDGHVVNPFTGTDFGGFERFTLRGKALYDGPGLDALLTVSYNEDEARPGLRQAILGAPLCVACVFTGATPPTGEYETFQGFDRLSTAEVFSATLKLDVDLSDELTLTSISAYRDADQVAGTDEGNFAGAGPFAIPLLLFSVDNNEGEDLLQEIRLASDFRGPLNFLFGVNGQKTDEEFTATVSGADPALPISSTIFVETRSISAYGEIYYELSDTVTATVGGRLNYDKKTADIALGDNLLFVPLVIPGFPVNYTYEDSWTDFTPSATLAWAPSSDQNYYLSYREAFKSGGFNAPSFGQSPSDILEPEGIRSYEFGAKNSFGGGALRTNLAIFYYEHSDIQVAFVDAIRGSVRENAGRSSAFGVELDVQTRPSDWFSFDFGYSYLDAEYDQYDAASLFQPSTTITPPLPIPIGLETTSVDLAGSPLTRAPKHTIYANANVNFDISDSWEVRFGGIIRHTSEYDFNPGRGGVLGLDFQDDLTLVNLNGSVGQIGDGLEIGFYVNNLFDVFYLKNVTTGQTGAYQGAALPRTYGAYVSFEF